MNDILFGNNNQTVLKRLSGRYFKANKNRNMIAVIAIVLTTTLFAAIFTLGFGMMDTIHDQNIRKAGGDGQAVLSYINDNIYEDVKGSPLIDRIAYSSRTRDLKNGGQKSGIWTIRCLILRDMNRQKVRSQQRTGRSWQIRKRWRRWGYRPELVRQFLCPMR